MSTEPEVVDTEALVVLDEAPQQVAVADLSSTNPVAALEKMQEAVQFMATKCTGPKYIQVISGNQYPKVDWWTTVGMSLSLFASEEKDPVRADNPDGSYTYSAYVEILFHGQKVGRASHIAASNEKGSWAKQESAVRSMAQTRATGKAFRQGFSGLAVLAGLQPTPAEEMPQQGQAPQQGQQPQRGPQEPRTPPQQAPKPDGPSEAQIERYVELMDWAVEGGHLSKPVAENNKRIAPDMGAGQIGAEIGRWKEYRAQQEAPPEEPPPPAAPAEPPPEKVGPALLGNLLGTIKAGNVDTKALYAWIFEAYNVDMRDDDTITDNMGLLSREQAEAVLKHLGE